MQAQSALRCRGCGCWDATSKRALSPLTQRRHAIPYRHQPQGNLILTCARHLGTLRWLMLFKSGALHVAVPFRRSLILNLLAVPVSGDPVGNVQQTMAAMRYVQSQRYRRYSKNCLLLLAGCGA